MLLSEMILSQLLFVAEITYIVGHILKYSEFHDAGYTVLL